MTNSKYSPDHYTQGIETWDYITSQNLGFLEGNVIKYITRAGKKAGESKLDDLLKAQTYIRKLISIEVNDAPRSDGPSPSIPHSDVSTLRDILPEYLRNPSSFN